MFFLFFLRSRIISLTHLYAICAVISMAHAAAYDPNMIGFHETFTRAQTTQPGYLSQQAQLQADRLQQKQALSGLLPSLHAEISHSTIDYDQGDQLGLNINQDTIDKCLGDSDATLANGLQEIECFLTPLDSKFNSTAFTVRLNQALFRLPRWHAYLRGRQISRQAMLKGEQATADLLLDSAKLYLTALNHALHLRTAQQTLSLQQQQLQHSQDQFNRGLTKRLAVLSANTAYTLALTQQQQAQLQYSNALDALYTWVQDFSVTLKTLPDDPLVQLARLVNAATVPEKTIGEWVQQAQQYNPDWQLSQVAVAISRQHYLSQKSQHAPTLDLFSQYSEIESDGSTSTIDEGQITQKSIGLSFNLPLYTGGLLSAQTKQAHWQHKQSQRQASEIEYQMALSIRQQLRLIETQKNSISALLPLQQTHQAAYVALQEQYTLGVYPISEVLHAQQEVTRLQQELIDLYVKQLSAYLELKRLTGSLQVEDLKRLDQHWASATQPTVFR